MKRKLFLQLFAEAGQDEQIQGQEEGKETGQEEKQPPKKKDEPKKKETKYTDEDLDRIINQKFADWQKKQEKAVDEAKKLAEMNAQEKAEYERDQFKKELAELREKNAISEMMKTARQMLADEEINISDELLANLVTSDAEETKASVQSFAKLFKDAVQNAVKDALKGNPPKTGKGSSVTKEQIMAIKNPAERQRMIAENINLFQ